MRRRTAITCFSGVFLSGLTYAQSTAKEKERSALYDKVLDAVLPSPSPRTDGQVAIILRFQPSLYAESQLALSYTEAGADATYLHLAQPLVVTLDKFWPNRTDSKEIATNVKVSKASKHFDSRTASLSLAQFWEALAQSPEALKRSSEGILLDGTSYGIAVEGPRFSISISIQDAEAAKGRVTGDVAIVRWANTMRVEMEK